MTAYRVSGHRFCSNAECPDHIPDWVAEWRSKKSKKEE